MMLGAIFYTQDARHPDTKPLTAYLAFATMFTLNAAAIFGGLMLLVQALDADDRLEHPLAMLAVQATVFVPAFLLGRRQMLRLPRRRRSEEHTSELQSLMRTPSAVFCMTTKTQL